jgi:hypothetical protein
MKKNLGDKRKEISDEQIELILKRIIVFGI